MADGNRSAKGKQVAVDDYDDHGPVGGFYGGAAGAFGWDWDGAATSGGTGSYGDMCGEGYGGLGFLPAENPVGGGGMLFPSTHVDARMYAPQHLPGPLYWPAGNGVVGSASFPSPFTGTGGSGPQLHAGTGYWPDSNGGGGSGSFSSPFIGGGTHGPQHAGSGNWPRGNGGGGSAPFPTPFTSAGVVGIPGPQHARTGNSWHTGADHEFYYRGNGDGSGGATFAPPHNMGDGMSYAVPYDAPNGGQPCSSSSPSSRTYMAQLDSDISRSLTSLSLRDRGSSRESLFARGRRHLSNVVNHGRQELQLVNAGGDLRNNAPFFPGPGRLRGRGGGDPYAGWSLEDVRGGAMSGVARDLAGCQFLVRMVAEGGAAAAGEVFEELSGEIVRLMTDSVAHELVEKLSEYWTDEQITRVLYALAASPNHIVAAVARNHAGSNILQTLVGRMAGNPEQAELFTSTLARAGDHGVVSLMEHSDGSRLIVRCLDTFSIYQNRFITAVVTRSFFVRRLCRDKHGCTVVNRCIDKAAAGDEQLLKWIVDAVCSDGIALAEHGYGNFVVQHVMRSVPEARDCLHALFRGSYVSLSRQKPSSHVVQGCLEHFSPEQADEIVRELLGCTGWDCTFRHLITDPYANYVLQSAMKRREIQMHNKLMDAISMQKNSLRDDRFAREVFRKM